MGEEEKKEILEMDFHERQDYIYTIKKSIEVYNFKIEELEKNILFAKKEKIKD